MLRLLLALILLLIAVPARAQTLPHADSFMLKNGLTVLVIPDHKIPAITHMVWYHIGGADEENGKRGLAHYLEHLMFKATGNLRPGEFSKLVAYYGGGDNAFTTADYTAYHQTLPKEHLNLAMLLESDRMRGLKLDEPTALKERDVILEERSMRVDNRPESLLTEEMNTALYGEDHPYGMPVIGWRKDIEQLTYKDAQDFHNHYYAPNNATVVIAGDVTLEEAKELAEKYYGPIPKNPDLKPDDRTVLHAEVTRLAPKEPVILKDKRAEQPQWVRYYVAPSARGGKGKEHALPLVLLSQVLGGGETSRLYQRLVVKDGLATGVGTYYNELALGPSSFKVYVTLKPGVSEEQITAAVESEIASFLKQGVSKEELRRAKNLLRADTIYARDSLKNMAYVYGEASATGMDVAYVEHWPERVLALTDKQVMAAANYMFRQHPRFVTGELLPDKGAKE